MDIKRIEVQHITTHTAPSIEVKVQSRAVLKRILGYGLRALAAVLRAARSLLPRRAYLTLE